MYLDATRTRLAQLGFIQPNTLKPCTKGEIESLHRSLGSELPKAYQEFLLLMGHGAGPILSGTHCFYEDLSEIQSRAAELLKENNSSFSLPDKSFVLLMHQGYYFLFFLIDGNDDPPLFSYSEGQQDNFVLSFNSFSEFLNAEIEFTTQVLREQNNR
ncbi:MAG: SMI1/KNR4 family protein [Ardenticatenaceae bacterium]|nr:SMI1/KNR4 family protein [Ardenticatenaceae bacterium]